MPILYCWNNNTRTADRYEEGASAEKFKRNIFYKYCYDTTRGMIEEYIYGIYVFKSGKPLWIHVPLNRFPKEFQAYILLLGKEPC